MLLAIRLSTLLLIICPAGLAFGQRVSATPSWQQIQGDWPAPTNQIRAMIVSDGALYVGVAGSVPNSAQVWKFADSGCEMIAAFRSYKVAVLQADADGHLYVGTGSPHSAEVSGKGHAEVWKIDTAGNKTRLRSFKNRDIAYSMSWFQEKLHVGMMTEDRPGTAEIWRFDDPGWKKVAGSGINGWPTDNTYAAVYEMSVHDGSLIAGTFGRTMGDGDVLKLKGDQWIDLDAPQSIIALSFETYRGQLVAAVSNSGARHPNPIFALQTDGTWQPLGVGPPEWKNAYIPNHMVVKGDELFLGVGGKPGTLSVWKYDGVSWTKIAGDGIHGSWKDPLVRKGAEWVYRLTFHRGKLYAGLASDRSPFRAQLWEMTP